jgi:hypothetical protein
MPNPIFVNLADHRFGKLYVDGYSHIHNDKRYWNCTCDCGKKIRVITYHLTSLTTTHCGCSRKVIVHCRKFTRKGKSVHGMTHTPEYISWIGCKKRCTNIKHRNYKYYGARGIYVCDRWKHSFKNFYLDMGKRPAGTSLDRIDNDGPYSPDNCRWATPRQQWENSRSPKTIEYRGIKTTYSDLARINNINISTFYYRIKRGWSIEKALSEPIIKIKLDKQ